MECPMCGRKGRPWGAYTTALASLALALSSFALWGPAKPQENPEIASMRERIAALEAKGASTVIFNLPEVKGSPYVNIDQKGYGLSIPTTPEANQTKAGDETQTSSPQSRKSTLKR